MMSSLTQGDEEVVGNSYQSYNNDSGVASVAHSQVVRLPLCWWLWGCQRVGMVPRVRSQLDITPRLSQPTQNLALLKRFADNS